MSEVTETDNKQPTEPTVQKKRPLWQKIIAGLVLLFLILVVIVNVATSAPVKVSNEFINDIQAGKANDAYSLFSSEAVKVVPKDQFQLVVNKIGPILNTKEKMTSKEINGQTGNAATAKVVYKITGTDNISYEITVNLIKDNGQWKVQNFDSNRAK